MPIHIRYNEKRHRAAIRLQDGTIIETWSHANIILPDGREAVLTSPWEGGAELGNTTIRGEEWVEIDDSNFKIMDKDPVSDLHIVADTDIFAKKMPQKIPAQKVPMQKVPETETR
jgi:hypothetical protein